MLTHEMGGSSLFKPNPLRPLLPIMRVYLSLKAIFVLTAMADSVPDEPFGEPPFGEVSNDFSGDPCYQSEPSSNGGHQNPVDNSILTIPNDFLLDTNGDVTLIASEPIAPLMAPRLSP